MTALHRYEPMRQHAIAIQHIKLENEGWERDYEVPEPAEPTFTEPAG